ncbi:extracellular solute-binding protein [Jatrophihabitans telluris]|uniref:Extracellular solute-binding protein n=1 Tax=Jatrophihabitans telluris TaxID=2038343 RepID=A0ABY4R472_9ACTN|nr:extracellular solute-binding protein [Jatrophihabitans telluris]UQX89754.1 extracellular solute-binding protein [Jatrophihabitans telluris]
MNRGCAPAAPNRRSGRSIATIARLAGVAGTAALAAVVLAACSGGTSVGGANAAGKTDSSSPFGFKTAAQDANADITVWVDSTRLDAAKAYQKANPAAKIKIVTYDGNANGSGTLKTKTQLFDKAGSGWPDVVFTTDNNSASWGSQSPSYFTAPLNKGLIDSSTLSGFAKGALDPCTVNGTVYCLRNDLAQDVLWYNKKLMDQWGYTVPATWEDYQALAGKVATEHPGYLVGTAGDAWTPEMYMWGSECPANQVTGAKAITVKATDPKCVRAATMLDSLIANKTMSTLPIFGADFAKTQGSKVLMMPGPAWYGGAVFQGTIKTPKGEIAVAPALHWADQSTPVTGNVGGGAWWISSHSKNLAAAKAFATWVTTSDAYQADLSPGFPAYSSAAAKWIAKQQASGYWANDISAPIIAAAGEVWSGWGSPEFSQEAVWSKVVISGMTQGKTIASLLPAWQKGIEDQAQVFGYTVGK